MAGELQLNKPLYKDDGPPPASAVESGAPPPRPPKPIIFPRIGATIIDLLALHGVMMLVIKLAPSAVVKLGAWGPWLGLFTGWLYLAVCWSSITLGRTLGKLIMRVQVSDLSGADLSFGKSAFRATLFLWPLGVILMLRHLTDAYEDPGTFSIIPALEILGPALTAGWLLGNTLHASFEPHGRALYDRLVGSLVVNAESEPVALQEFFTSARQPADPKLVRRAHTYFGVAMAALLALGSAAIINHNRAVKALSDSERERSLGYQKAFHLPDFGQAIPVQPSTESPDRKSTRSMEVINAAFQFRRRAPVPLEELKADKLAMSALSRLMPTYTGDEFRDNLRKYLYDASLAQLKSGDTPLTAPKSVRIEVSFAELADLFFARQSFPIYMESKEIVLPPGFLETTAPLVLETGAR